MREIKFRAWDKKEKMMWSADIDCFWSQIEVEGKDNHIIMQ